MLQQRFDLQEWATLRGFDWTNPEDYWPGSDIDCPQTLAEYERKRMSLRDSVRFEDPIKCDIAVYSIGEPDSGACTMLGGRPWLPTDAEWPIGTNGIPCAFLGQVYFAESADLVPPKLPGVMVQIFANLCKSGYAEYWEEEERLMIWRSADEISRGCWRSHPQGHIAAAPCCALFHRGEDYGKVTAKAEADPIELENASGYERFTGTKIGGLPSWIQSDDGDHPAEDIFVCSLGSMFHHIEGQKDVFVNMPDFDRQKVIDLGMEPCCGDMGVIGIMMRPDGSFYTTFECC